MRLIPRDYQKHVIIFVLIDFVVSFSLPFLMLFLFNGNLGKEVDPTIINGILTATAIVFGFVTFELREIKSSMEEKFILSLPLLFFMMITLLSILSGVILGVMTVVIALEATANCLFNIFYIFPVMVVKEKWNKETI
ncbi:MAG: hypothetical protein ABSB71_01835 [Candidatus Bathyarchaeia archaeon]|jgi:hypothetical protein